MPAVTETFPGALPAINQKSDVQTVPSGQEDNWVDAGDMNDLGQFTVSMARALRNMAGIAAVTDTGQTINAKAFKFTGVIDATTGLPKVTTGLATDLDRLLAIAMEKIEQGGDFDGTASATPFFGVNRGLVTFTGTTGQLYELDTSGALATYTSGALPPIAVQRTSAVAEMFLGGVVRADNNDLEFNTSGLLQLKTGASGTLGNTLISGTLTVTGKIEGLGVIDAITSYDISGVTVIDSARKGTLTDLDVDNININGTTISTVAGQALTIQSDGGDGLIQLGNTGEVTITAGVGQSARFQGDNADGSFIINSGGIVQINSAADVIITAGASNHVNIVQGGLEIGGTEVIDSGLNINNIASITASDIDLTTTGDADAAMVVNLSGGTIWTLQQEGTQDLIWQPNFAAKSWGINNSDGSLLLTVRTNPTDHLMAFGRTFQSTALVQFEQAAAARAIPVLELEQTDVDEPFVIYKGTAAAADMTRSIVDVGDVTTATAVGYVKIEIDDVGNQVTDGDYYIEFVSLA